jgi:hypothetical protein
MKPAALLSAEPASQPVLADDVLEFHAANPPTAQPHRHGGADQRPDQAGEARLFRPLPALLRAGDGRAAFRRSR